MPALQQAMVQEYHKNLSSSVAFNKNFTAATNSSTLVRPGFPEMFGAATAPPAASPTVLLQGGDNAPVMPPHLHQQQNNQQHQQGFSAVGILILSGLLAILSTILVALVIHIVRLRHRYRLRRPRWPAQLTPKRVLDARIARRYETVEGWMISKRVLPHDDFCGTVHTSFVLQEEKKKKEQEEAKKGEAEAAEKRKKEEEEEGEEETGREEPASQTHTSKEEGEQVDVEVPTSLPLGDGNDGGIATSLPSDRNPLPCLETGCIRPPKSTAETVAGDTDDDDDDWATSSSCAGSVFLSDDGMDGEDPYQEFSNHSCTEKECPICMEEFKVGDVVSWSAHSSKQCRHVFHHACIKEWLLRHMHCPMCRQVMMSVDELRGRRAKTQEALQQCSLDYLTRAASTYYCIQEGLVEIPAVITCTKSQLKGLSHKICDCAVKRSELAKTRGCHAVTAGGLDKSQGASSSHPGDNALAVVLGVDNEDDEQPHSNRSVPTTPSTAMTMSTDGGDGAGVSNEPDEELGGANPSNNELPAGANVSGDDTHQEV